MVEIKITKTENISILSKISYILVGILIATSLCAVGMRIGSTTGLYVSTILSIILTFLGFKYTKKKSRSRLLTWGMLGTLILFIGIYIIFMATISSVLESN
jgi:uncharacterized protein YacL